MNNFQNCGPLLITVHCPLTAEISIFSPPPLPQPTHKQWVSFAVDAKCNKCLPHYSPFNPQDKSCNSHDINNITVFLRQTKSEIISREFDRYVASSPANPPINQTKGETNARASAALKSVCPNPSPFHSTGFSSQLARRHGTLVSSFERPAAKARQREYL